MIANQYPCHFVTFHFATSVWNSLAFLHLNRVGQGRGEEGEGRRRRGRKEEEKEEEGRKERKEEEEEGRKEEEEVGLRELASCFEVHWRFGTHTRSAVG